MNPSLGRYEEACILSLRALTPLHIGIGRSIGSVDLPIQRDAFGFPTIPSSSLKGAIKSFFFNANKEIAKIIFGPEPLDEEHYAGFVAINDAFLIAMPARSLKGVYAYVSSSFMLRNLLENLEIMESLGSKESQVCERIKDIKNKLCSIIEKGDQLEGNCGLVASDSVKNRLVVHDNKAIINEEFVVECKVCDEMKELAKSLLIGEKTSSTNECWRFMVLSDNIIRDVVERSIIRRRRIGLERESKTVKEGALWSEEDVPQGTLFQTLVLFSQIRGKIKRSSLEEDLSAKWKSITGKEPRANGVKEYFESELLPSGRGYLLFGGHETVGRGLVKLAKVV